MLALIGLGVGTFISFRLVYRLFKQFAEEQKQKAPPDTKDAAGKEACSKDAVTKVTDTEESSDKVS